VIGGVMGEVEGGADVGDILHGEFFTHGICPPG
jgi:hypothetical protein